MELIIGGAHQGKLSLVMARGYSMAQVRDGENCPLHPQQPAEVLYGLHHLIRRAMEEELPIPQLLSRHIGPETVVICDEVGCGIVPMEKKQRQWREAVGRACCYLAQQANRVERVCCGIPMTIKGGETR